MICISRLLRNSGDARRAALAGLILLASCATTQRPAVREDSLMLTRKYVGNFVEYRQYVPEKLGDPHLIWIKTTLDSTLGKITAYGDGCDFRRGDRLYIRRTYLSPGPISSYWEYLIESDDNPVSYRLSEYQSDRKNHLKDWF